MDCFLCTHEAQNDGGRCFPDIAPYHGLCCQSAAGAIFTDTDAVLQHILSFAALRYLREGSSTVTLDDVRAALGIAAPLRP